ncbi:MAG: hypothetical protein NVSMB6_32060 [Burkholderiaceae bacterium]
MLLHALALAAVTVWPPFADSVDAVAAQAMKQHHIPGLAIGVTTKAGVYLRGYGIRVAGKPDIVTPKTLFQVGSVTKMFTAAAVIRAASSAGFSLDSPVSTLLTGLPPCASVVTLRELLSDRAGLKDVPGEDGSHDPQGLTQYTDSWDGSYCIESPDRSFSYSNPGFTLAGRALQELARKPYQLAMQQYAFGPFGMTAATFDPSVALANDHALGHRVESDVARPVSPPVYDTRLLPAGYLYDNLSDLVMFLRNTFEGPEGRMLATPQIRVPILFDNAYYAYGLFVRSDGPDIVVEHAGTLGGSGALVRMLPQRHVGIVVLSNLETIPLPRVVDEIDHAVTGRNATQGGVVQLADVLPVSDAEARSLVGTYENRITARISLADAKHPMIQVFGGDFAFGKLGPDTYYALPHGPKFSLVHDGKRRLLQIALWSLPQR